MTQPTATSEPVSAPATDQRSAVIYEIYASVQGESTWAGLPCVFVRLAGCPLRCVWCDTEYAFYGGKRQSFDEILAEVRRHEIGLVEVTGGEPLAQPQCPALLHALLDEGYDVLLETSGAYSTAEVPEAVRIILDMKCPASGESEKNDYENLARLRPHDEVKFVIGSREDFDFAAEICAKYELSNKAAALLFSPVFGEVDPQDLSDWVIASKIKKARMQLQMHKYIWEPNARGV